MLTLQAFDGTVHWSQMPIYVSAEVLAGVAAALSYVVISRARARRPIEIEAEEIARQPEPVA
jgi:glycerol uptake facilitator protein